MMMKNLDEYARNKFNIKWLSEKAIIKYMGYRNDDIEHDADIDSTNINKEPYYPYDYAINLIRTKYNRRNPELILLHQHIGFITDDYTIEAKTLCPIIQYLQNNNIEYRLQMPIDYFNRRVDLFIVQYEIVVECDENGHNDRDPFDEERRIKELQLKGYTIIKYNPNSPTFNNDKLLDDIKVEIKNKTYQRLLQFNDMQGFLNELRTFNESALEKKYFDLFGTALLYDDDFCVFFDDVANLCGYTRIDSAKKLLLNYCKLNIDYVIKKKADIINDNKFNHIFKRLKSQAPLSSGAVEIKIEAEEIFDKPKKTGWCEKEYIFLTGNAFKCFCMLARTSFGDQIRMWYIGMEKRYYKILSLVSSYIINQNKSIVKLVDEKIIEKTNERKIEMKKIKNKLNSTETNNLNDIKMTNNINCNETNETNETNGIDETNKQDKKVKIVKTKKITKSTKTNDKQTENEVEKDKLIKTTDGNNAQTESDETNNTEKQVKQVKSNKKTKTTKTSEVDEYTKMETFQKFFTEIYRLIDPTDDVNYDKIVLKKKDFDIDVNAKYDEVLEENLNDLQKQFGVNLVSYKSKKKQKTYVLHLIFRLVEELGYATESKEITNGKNKKTTQYTIYKND
jgi:very-short-patch-repair endonuclease